MYVRRAVGLHQIDFARSHFERIIGLREGQVLFDTPASDITPDMIGALYRIASST